MSISARSRATRAAPIEEARAADVEVTEDLLRVQLTDGRAVSVPLAWFPRLSAATPSQRAIWELIGDGSGIHWPEIDEDLEVLGLLGQEGRRVGERVQGVRLDDEAVIIGRVRVEASPLPGNVRVGYIAESSSGVRIIDGDQRT